MQEGRSPPSVVNKVHRGEELRPGGQAKPPVRACEKPPVVLVVLLVVLTTEAVWCMRSAHLLVCSWFCEVLLLVGTLE